MRNFTKQISGEAEPRTFRYDVETQTLFTDMEIENQQGGFPEQTEAKITEESAGVNPIHERYWVQTHVEREAYRICAEEDIPLDEAFAKVNGQPPPTKMPVQPPPPPSEMSYRPSEEPEPNAMSPIAGIIISNQQLILGMAFNLLDQYITEDDPNAKMLTFLKEKIEELDGHEIIV